MDLLSRLVGIWILFVIYIVVRVDGTDYGATCSGSGTGDCTEKTKIVCDTTCKCTADSFRKGGKECAATSQPTDQCVDANAECTAGKTCVCKSGYFEDKDGKCSAQILLKATCTASQPTDQCVDANAECTAGNTCVCKSGYSEDKDGKCSAPTCTASQPAGQCADALAECTSGNTCVCKSGNFENKDRKCSKQIAALDETCVASEPASDQCAVDNAECTTNGTAKCQCKVTHYVNVAACAIRKSPKVSCGSGECVTHASCDSGTSKCVCDAGYDPSPTVSPTMCSGVVKVITQSYIYLVPIIVSMMLHLR